MTDSSRPVPRIPVGFRDVHGERVELRRRMIDTVLGVYRRYGFAALETPSLEYVDALGKFLPEANQPDAGIFAFREDGEDSDWVSLRYDLTAPLARYVAEHEKTLPLPFRRYQTGLVWRREKPGPGRFREFVQCDFDTVGTSSPLADAEVCCILADAFEALGIERGKYVVRVNDRKVVNGVLERAGVLGGESDPERAGAVLRALDKLDRVGIDGVRALLGKGRHDKSGDFTKGAELEPAAIDAVVRYLELPREDRSAHLAQLAALVEGSAVGAEGVAELAAIDAYLTRIGYGSDRVVFDPTVVRGLAYYTGPVFEAELTFEITDEHGQLRRFGSVAGGGRYDGLVERFLGRTVPATGASIGVDRLVAALDALGLFPGGREQQTVLVLVMGADTASESFAIAHELRAAGMTAEVFMGSGGMGKQMKYADAHAIRCAVILGSNELASGTIAIKDLRAGKELSKNVTTEAWHGKGGERPGQFTVPRGELVAKLREIFAS